MKLSKEQSRILEVYQQSNSNIAIEANAGSGKTFIVAKIAAIADVHKRIAFITFTKSAVKELKHRIPSHMNSFVGTIHRLGYNALSNHFKEGIKIDDWKSFNMAMSLMKLWKIPAKSRSAYATKLRELIAIFRLHSCENAKQLLKACYLLGKAPKKTQIEHALQLHKAIQIYNKERIKERKKIVVDLTDMLYIPATYSEIKMAKFDEVFVDEAQDCNLLQQRIIKKVTKPTGRFIAVGDRKQAIFMFAGADPNSFNNFSKTPNTIKLPLSTTYRCSVKIVNYANTIYPGMKWRSQAPLGDVRNDSVMKARSGDFVLCRNCAPLVGLYFDLITQGKRCFIRGEDLRKAFQDLLEEHKHKGVSYTIKLLENKLNEVKTNLIKKHIKYPTRHPKYLELRDKVNAIKKSSTRFKTTYEILNVFESMFEQKQEGIVLMTMHKSKGSEAKRVFIIRPDLIPAKFALTKEMKKQEKNLWYVAVTRAKELLVIDDEYDVK